MDLSTMELSNAARNRQANPGAVRLPVVSPPMESSKIWPFQTDDMALSCADTQWGPGFLSAGDSSAALWTGFQSAVEQREISADSQPLLQVNLSTGITTGTTGDMDILLETKELGRFCATRFTTKRH
jgi:hypothetical protein